MLLLDAMEDAPTVYVVLTAREFLTRKQTHGDLQHFRRRLRKRWPDLRYTCQVEFQRKGRMHLNLLVKGVPVEELDEFRRRMAEVWCSRVDAEASCQWADAIHDHGGIVRYVSLHFLKEEQAPPLDWKGHRFSCTRDYLVRPAAELRAEARRSLRLRSFWSGHSNVSGKVLRERVIAGENFDEVVEELVLGTSDSWTLRHVNPSTVRLDVDRVAGSTSDGVDRSACAAPLPGTADDGPRPWSSAERSSLDTLGVVGVLRGSRGTSPPRVGETVPDKLPGLLCGAEVD